MHRYRGTLCLSRSPWHALVLVVVVGVTIPFAMYAPKTTTSDEVSMDLPRGLATTTAYDRMVAEFG